MYEVIYLGTGSVVFDDMSSYKKALTMGIIKMISNRKLIISNIENDDDDGVVVIRLMAETEEE